MKKLISIFLVLMLVVTSVTCLSVSAASDPRTSSGAVNITLGKTYTASWSRASGSNFNYYSKFTLPSRGFIALSVQKTMVNGDYMDMDFIIYNSSGTIVWQADNGEQKNSFSSYFQYKVGLNKGTYYLNLLPESWSIPYEESQTIRSTYSVGFKSTNYYEVEPNNTKAQATVLTVGQTYSAVYTDESYDSSYVDFFKVYLTKGRQYCFKLGNYAKLNSTTALIRVLDSSLSDLGRFNDNGLFYYKAAYSGYYYIKLWNSGNEAGISYTVTVNDLTPRINATKASIYVGYTTQLKILNNNYYVRWNSSNSRVAVVSSKGLVKGRAAGTATITATANNRIYKCVVTVKKLVVKAVAVAPKAIIIPTGAVYQLKSAISPSDIPNAKVLWKSSNPAVVAVSSTGKIVAKKAGAAFVAAGFKGKRGLCKVVVKDAAVKLSATSLKLVEGKTAALKAAVYPSSLTYKTVTWVSTNPAVATVSATGVITAKKAGLTTISASCGNKRAFCSLTVTKLDEAAVRANIKTLKAYIEKNHNFVTGDGFNALKSYVPVNGGQIYVVISNHTDTGKLEIYTSLSADAGMTSCSYDLDFDNTFTIQPSCAFASDGATIWYHTTTTLDARTITKGQSMTFSISSRKNITTQDAANMSAKSVELSIQAVNYLVFLHTRMTTKEIGFFNFAV